MNERIKQLEPQCWEHNEFGLNFNYKKFAELIVAECMDVVAKKCASPTAYNALAQHWEVEE